VEEGFSGLPDGAEFVECDMASPPHSKGLGDVRNLSGRIGQGFISTNAQSSAGVVKGVGSKMTVANQTAPNPRN
jgi:hypothetical protein